MRTEMADGVFHCRAATRAARYLRTRCSGVRWSQPLRSPVHQCPVGDAIPGGASALHRSNECCNVTREDVAGFPTDQAAETYKGGKIWYARLGSNQMVPVRMEFDTEFGSVRGILASCAGPASTSGSWIEPRPSPQGVVPIRVSSTKRSVALSIARPLRPRGGWM